jgi:hypothetical protein
VKVTGAVSGKVAGTIPAANENKGRVGNLSLDLTAPKLTVQNIPAERLTGKATVKDGAIDYALEGKTLGGSFEVKGSYPGAAQKKGNAAPGKGERGRLRVTDLDLSQLSRALKVDSLKPLRGRVDVTFDYDNDLMDGAGRVLIRGLRWGDATAGNELAGVLVLREGTLELRDLNGSIAHGQLSARGRVRLHDPARNFVSVSLTHADAKKLLAPVPQLAGTLDGDISVQVRGSFGRTVRGSGTVTFSRGALGSTDLAAIRVPFTYSVSPGGFGRVAVREATTHGGAGRVLGGITADWAPGTGMHVTGQLRFIDLPLRTIAPKLGDNAFLGNGRITGRFDVNGTNVRSANDLTGNLVAVLNNASPKEIPLLQVTMPYLNPLGLTKPFDSGDIRANLAGGIFRIQRLALANPAAQLVASGTVRVTTMQLDLDVVAHTGTIGPESAGLRLLAARIPAFGPLPIGLIRDVSSFVSNRTVRLTVTGKASSPVVKVNTAALLGDEAVRFFLTRYILPAQAAEVLGIGSSFGGILGGTTGNK